MSKMDRVRLGDPLEWPGGKLVGRGCHGAPKGQGIMESMHTTKKHHASKLSPGLHPPKTPKSAPYSFNIINNKY